MKKVLKSFKIQKGNKILDYRLGENLDLNKVKEYFQSIYHVKKMWQGPRHILGILEKENIEYFLKLSRSEGIGEVAKNEYDWNNFFNSNYSGSNFVVPKNYDRGLFEDKYYYLITDYLKGQELLDIEKYLPQIIELSELIQKLPEKKDGYIAKFTDKVNKWFNDIPGNVRKKYDIESLLGLVLQGVDKLKPKVRHGDFAPWHLIKIGDKKLGLIDGEHFRENGVENYDICYFIQRVWSVLKNPQAAKKIYQEVLKRGYDHEKLKVVLATRAIGGFLDESLKENPDYKFAEKFKNWVIGKDFLTG